VSATPEKRQTRRRERPQTSLATRSTRRDRPRATPGEPNQHRHRATIAPETPQPALKRTPTRATPTAARSAQRHDVSRQREVYELAREDYLQRRADLNRNDTG